MTAALGVIGENLAQIREQVIATRKRQQERFKGQSKITCNARLGAPANSNTISRSVT